MKINWKALEEFLSGAVSTMGGHLAAHLFIEAEDGKKVLNPVWAQYIVPVIAKNFIDEEAVNEWLSEIFAEEKDVRDKFTSWSGTLTTCQRAHLFVNLAQGLIGGETADQQCRSARLWKLVVNDILRQPTNNEKTRYAINRRVILDNTEYIKVKAGEALRAVDNQAGRMATKIRGGRRPDGTITGLNLAARLESIDPAKKGRRWW